MAKKTKPELIEEAHDLGLEVDPDDNYSDIFELVKMAREDRADEEERVMDAPPPSAMSSDPDPTQEEPEADGDGSEVPRDDEPTSWPFNEYGVYVGRKVQV